MTSPLKQALIDYVPILIQSNTTQMIVSSGIQSHMENYGRGFTILGSFISDIATTVTTPIWLIKHIASFTLSVFPQNSQAKSLAKREAINLGVDLLSPLIPLANLIYPLSPLKNKVQEQIPEPFSSLKGVLTQFNMQLDKLGEDLGGRDNLIKLLKWIEENPQLFQELISEVPELKPFASILSTLAHFLKELESKVKTEEELRQLLSKLEEMFTPPVIEMTRAVANRHFAGKSLVGKVDYILTCTAIALSAPFHLITNLFLIIISSPLALISVCSRNTFFAHSVKFIETQQVRFLLNVKCMGISFASLLFPSIGQKWLGHQMSDRLPAGGVEFIQALAIYGQGNLKEKEEEIQQFVRFMSSPSFSKASLPKILTILQNSPKNIEKLNELIDIIPALSNAFPRDIFNSFASLAPHLVKLSEKNPEALQEAIQLATQGNNPTEIIKQMAQKHPELKKQMIATLIESPNILSDMIPALSTVLPNHIVSSFTPLVPHLVKLSKEHPKAMQEVIQLATEGNNPIEVIKKYPELKKQIITILRGSSDILPPGFESFLT